MGAVEYEGLRAVIFVGPKQKFAQCLTKALEQELEQLDVVKKHDFQDLYNGIDAIAYRVELIVIDETLCDQVVENFAKLRRTFPAQIICVAYNQFERLPESARALTRNGMVRSFLPMNLRLDIWISTVQLMMSGGDYMPPEFLRAMTQDAEPMMKDAGANGHMNGTADSSTANGTNGHVNGNRSKPAKSAMTGNGKRLTAREIDVLELVSKGLQNKIIAAELKLSQHTVKLHMHNIIAKLGVSNRTEAAAIYFEQLNDGSGNR